MERITCMCLLLTAVVSSSAGAPRQYHFVNQNLNWTEAQRYCRENHTDLVTISDIQEQNDIEQAIKSSSDRVWIGLKNTWIWSLSDPAFYTEHESQFRNWDTKPHQQPNGDGDCVYLDCGNGQNSWNGQNCGNGQNSGNYLKGQWHDVDCSSTRHFICYNGSSKGFVSGQGEKNWTEAQKYCRQYHTDLARVRNQSENQQIQKITTVKQVWIGLHRLWVWSDNSTSTFTHWQSNRPTTSNTNHDDCALIDRQGRWTDEDCSNQRPFVCYDDKLVLIRENKTWTEALRHCRNMDMDLVSVDSEQMQRWVKILLMKASASSTHVWLGLRHSSILGGVWYWVNGQTVCYDQWASDYDKEPNILVKMKVWVAIQTRDNHWISRPETEEINFICIK
ncbi:C-type mannose receptor 2-like [Cyprinus carpio]|uniref:C-type mannose receptor 2-like n=1 Tax=Cyprinus carpio TaxID=7962 RepID=A0A9Q9VR53_CYPCA|nr:C-type mannose receptor 2-like [Cyprinus carpio]